LKGEEIQRSANMGANCASRKGLSQNAHNVGQPAEIVRPMPQPMHRDIRIKRIFDRG